MKNIKKALPSLIGLVATTSLAAVSGGLINTTTMNILGSLGGNIGASLAANFLAGFTPAKIKKWFVDTHPNDLNHSIKKLFVHSINEALYNIRILFLETQATDNEKKEAQQLIKTLQKQLPDMFLKKNEIPLDEDEIKHFLYEKGQEERIYDLIENQFGALEITEPFKSFLAKNLPAQIQLCFGEGLKDPAHQNAWIAFQRMLVEEIRNDIKHIADTQQSIKEDLSDLKFEKSGFSEEQTAEIRQFIKILNDKKLIEVKINDSINQSLTSIENKANEIIRITTKTQLTVEELKHILEKINRQNRTNHIIIYTFTACLIVAGAFAVYKLINQPFTATVKVYGWESEQHNPLDGKGTLVLTFGDKTENAPINRQGEAVFKGILPEYNGKSVTAYLTDTEDEPYYLQDTLIKIEKNEITNVQVLLRGLAQFEGRIVEVVGENKTGVADAMVYVNDLNAKTDERGYFNIDIPSDKQKREQYVEVSKEGYITYTNNAMPMMRKKTDTGCEIVVTRSKP